jgi:hypothetical protein
MHQESEAARSRLHTQSGTKRLNRTHLALHVAAKYTADREFRIGTRQTFNVSTAAQASSVQFLFKQPTQREKWSNCDILPCGMLHNNSDDGKRWLLCEMCEREVRDAVEESGI